MCEMEYMIKYAKTNSCKTIVCLIKYTNIIEKKENIYNGLYKGGVAEVILHEEVYVRQQESGKMDRQ